ncbi:Kelch-like protein terF [Colletotrichum orbiculare MAFF 240422]|uniref:Kelch-like protein terF n=1 Tax=Colletotrichum orbiculare (strain 104-T / ATCC 96160 / CBS 514.97 / LARS 414 / MAFF 240422) TaxID=1213857 RepID=N4VBD5_COLOR|nr:Kelch-like protein terF [Colletotrichum orbiculare MAFF 240422]
MRYSLKLVSTTVLGLLELVSAACSANNSSNWLNLAPIPSPRQEQGTVAINNDTIAIVGGIVLDGNTTNTVMTDLLQLYDIPSNTWKTVTPVPYAVNHPNVAAVDGKLYLLGGLVMGRTISGISVNWVASGDCRVYDASKDTWTELSPMPNGTERGSAIVGVHGEMIYLAGGMTILQDTYQDTADTVTAFNTTSGEWQRLPAAAAVLPEGRQHGTGAVIGNTFYVVGGRWFGQTDTRDTVYELDLTDLEAGWQTSKGHMAVARGGLNGGAIGNRFYAFGGEGSPDSTTGVFNQSEVFDTESQQWTELGTMPVPRHGTQAAAVGGRVYIPGGGLQQDGKLVYVNGVMSFMQPTAHFDAFCP